MPYNPSSAYPRHTTYTPPVYGRGFARGFNEVDWGQRFGHANVMPSSDPAHALRAAAPKNTGADRLTMEAVGRQGIGAMALGWVNQRAAERRQTTRTRKIWNRAEYGDDPNEIADAKTESAAPEGPVLWLPRSARETGGRQHVGGVNDRLNDIAAREESSTAMDQIVDNVLNSTDVGGPAKVKAPVWRRGFSRQRGGT